MYSDNIKYFYYHQAVVYKYEKNLSFEYQLNCISRRYYIQIYKHILSNHMLVYKNFIVQGIII